MNPTLTTFRTLVIDDYPEILELLVFLIETNFLAEVVTATSPVEAKRILDSDPNFDLVISDMNMPDGSGLDVYKHLQSKSIKIPVIFVSSDTLDQYPDLKVTGLISHVAKPFTDEDVIQKIERAMNKNHLVSNQYIPVHLSLLRKINKITVPLFVKINDNKYVKISPEESMFLSEEEKKYIARGVTHLYIESLFADQFISSFRKETLSKEAWDTLTYDEATENLKLNIELLRSVSSEMGWPDNIVSLAEVNLKKSLHLAKNHPQLSRVLREFQKIERFGYADYCVMMNLVTANLATATGWGGEATLRKMAFASLVHNMSLSEEEYAQKNKYLKMIAAKEATNTKDIKNILGHPAKAAELVRN